MTGPAIDSIDGNKLKALMRMKPRLEDTAILMDVSAKTIERFIRQEFDMTFRDFRELHMVHCRHELIRTAFEIATGDKNVVMLIFCLKNMCGWKNEPGLSDDGETQPTAVTITNEQLRDLVSAARGLKAVK